MEREEEQGLWWEKANSYLCMLYSGGYGNPSGDKQEWLAIQSRLKCTNWADGIDEGELTITLG